MSIPFNSYWLEPGAAVPVDIATTDALVTEIQRLRQALAQPEQKREWVGLTLEEVEGIIKSNITITDQRLYDGVYAVAVDIEAALKNKSDRTEG